jgi:FAD/FMN-containing dehydrogenase
MSASIPSEVMAGLKAALGPHGWSEDPARLEPKLNEWRSRWHGSTPLLLLPADVEQVAAVVRLCNGAGVAITPQGGNTGLVGGQIPQGEPLLSLERMRAVREVSPLDDAIIVEAGVTLHEAHEAAMAAGRHFPLALASGGSATIGGALSTNAGGTAVLRYGTMRDLALGIEAVLPNGEVFNGLKRLRKDNTGYDLKQLLIGAEGTLGVITAASLKLFPVLASRAVAIAGVADPQAAVELLALAKARSGGLVEAFELIGRLGLELVLKHVGGREPLAGPHPWYVLIETAGAEPGAGEAAMERILAEALERGLARDAAIATSEAQARAYWALRENQSAGQKPEGQGWKHDIAVPVSAVPAFFARADAALLKAFPGVRIVAFGHVGDGNVHYNMVPPEGGDADAFAAQREAAARIVHDIVHDLGGSISAEHGIGVMKAAEALRYKSAVEVEAMRSVRRALDPKRIMNPRVLF